jgi:hypothetical protein
VLTTLDIYFRNTVDEYGIFQSVQCHITLSNYVSSSNAGSPKTAFLKATANGVSLLFITGNWKNCRSGKSKLTQQSLLTFTKRIKDMCELSALHSMGILLLFYCLNCNKDCNSSLPIESSDNSQKDPAQSVDSDPKLGKLGRHNKRATPPNMLSIVTVRHFCK